MSAVTPYDSSNIILFTPEQVPGCALWLDAADRSTLFQDTAGTTPVTTSGQTVARWNDKSGNNNNAVTVNTLYPTYNLNSSFVNLPTLRFTATNWSNNTLTGVNIMSLPTFQNTLDVSMFYVSIPYTNTLMRPFFILKQSGGQTFIESQTNLVRINLNSFTGADISIPLVVNNSYISHAIYNSSTKIFSGGQNGSNTSYSTGTGTFATSNATSISVGAFRNGTFQNSGFNGEILEIIVYNTVLTTSYRQQIESYLAWKWNLQLLLPNNHPYKNAPYNAYRNLVIPRVNLTNSMILLPNQISGMSLWLDAADSATIIRSGSNVSEWRNKVLGLTGTQTYNGTVRYNIASLNNIPIINVESGGFYASFNTPLANSVHTTFMVMNMTSIPSNGTPIMTYAQSAGILASRPLDYAFNTFRNLVRYPNTVGVSVASILNNFIIVRSAITLDTISIVINGGQSSESNSIITNTGTITGYGVGYSYETSTRSSFPGNLAEVITFSRALTINEYQQIEGYLAWKWGLQSNLPRNHPAYIQPLPVPLPLTIKPYNFSPIQFSGCALWLDAADSASVIRSGSNVTQWNDKSGNGYNVSQSTSGNRPTYSYNQIVFNGSQWLRNTTSTSFGNSGTLIIVARSSTNIGSGCPINITSVSKTQVGMYLGSQYTVYFYNSTNNKVSGVGGTTTSLSIFVNTRNSASNPEYNINGSNLTSYTAIDPAVYTFSGTIELGSVNNGVNARFRGNINEIIYFNTYLTATQRQQVEGYLAWKWGLQKSLPSSHPFYNYPPG